MMVPTRPVLRPPVTMQRFPESNLITSWILPEAMSSWMESCTLMTGSGYLMVRPSLVYRNGTPLGPVLTLKKFNFSKFIGLIQLSSVQVNLCLSFISVPGFSTMQDINHKTTTPPPPHNLNII